MSNNNYMDRVPVKISENFKPPPKLYQLPQVIVNKLQLPDKHYDESPHYDYDFQLEHKVLAKIPEWRRMRQKEREARRDRKERREQEHLFQIEAKNKQMLGAVSYPSTDDLSSSDSDSGDVDKEKNQNNYGNTSNQATDGDTRLLLTKQVNSFHTILQPTIISTSNVEKFRMLNNTQPMNLQSNSAINNVSMAASVVKEANAFNYRDFEEDTSSPFDNIELKTINDLDILAQVLHNTQLPMKMQNDRQIDNTAVVEEDIDEVELKPKDNKTQNVINEANTIIDDIATKPHTDKKTKTDVDSLEILENTKIALQKVVFENLDDKVEDWRNDSIPNIVTTIANSVANIKYFTGPNSNIPSACTSMAASSYPTFPNHQQTMQQCYQMSYNGVCEQQQKQHYTNFNVHHTKQGGGTSTLYSNHNYLQGTNYNDNIAANCSPRHLQYHNATTKTAMNSAYLCNNANNYGNATGFSNYSADAKNLQNQHNKCIRPNDCNEIDSKSKSVPDILRELSAEVRNSEIRRSRYYSFNSEEENQSAVGHSVDEDVTPTQSPTKVSNTTKETNCYAKLPRPAQRLVKNISSMGFPLERVAKISQIFGTDDKKIIEHLIPLSELMDLGFDESKISEALIQFNNNKEKALEYLIS